MVNMLLQFKIIIITSIIVPYENLDTAIYNLITEPFVKIPVSFNINYNKTSGKTNYGPRYYAYDVILEYVF